MKKDNASEELNTTIVSLVFLMVLLIVCFFVIVFFSYEKLLHAAEDNGRITVEQSRKMLLISQLAELARSRTRLTAQITDIDDVFEQDELNLRLEQYAGRFAQFRQELLAFPLVDAEKIILQQNQPRIVARILPAQRQAVELAMSGNVSDKIQAKNILYATVLPGQQELIDSFHELIKLQDALITNNNTVIYDSLRQAEKNIFRLITGTAVLTVILLTIIVYRIQRIQIRLRAVNENLEMIVYQRTYALEDARVKLQRNLDIVDKNVLMLNTDDEGIIKSASRAFCEVSGYAEKELVGSPLNDMLHADAPADSIEQLFNEMSTGDSSQTELQNRTKAGDIYWVNLLFEKTLNKEGEITGYTIIMQDITSKKQLETLSITDSLTGMFNRLKVDEVLNYEVTRSVRYGISLCVVLFDIDNFKKINDTFGHQTGDVVLKEIAAISQSRAREVDTVGRWGGEEFIVICPQTGIKGASGLAEGLRLAFSSHAFDTVDRVTCSFGVAEYNPGESTADMLKRADVALYQAKHEGRNKVVLAEDE